MSSPLSPYPGLQPFREDEGPFFHGRDDEIALIAANLAASPLTILYGPSGVGKSSLLNAGVAARLRSDPGRAPNPDAPATAVVVFRDWQNDPLRALLAAVHRELGGPPPELPLREWLRRACVGRHRDLYLILDQFEEYFLYRTATFEQGSFAAELAAAVYLPEVNFLISIREDALAKLDVFKGRIARLFDNYLRVDHLTPAAAKDAIELPIAAFNDECNPPQRVSIDPGLTERILRELSDRPAAKDAVGRGALGIDQLDGRVEAPFLQIVLRRLWERDIHDGNATLRLSTLDELHGCDRIIESHLDSVLASLSIPERDLCADLFHHLVTPGGAKIAHTVPDLSAYAESPAASVDALVRILTAPQKRILREVPPDRGFSLSRYEIFHDALAPAILAWRRRWVAESARVGRQITASAFQDTIDSAIRTMAPSTEFVDFSAGTGEEGDGRVRDLSRSRITGRTDAPLG